MIPLVICAALAALALVEIWYHLPPAPEGQEDPPPFVGLPDEDAGVQTPPPAPR